MAAMFQAQQKEKETLKVSDSLSTTKHTKASKCKEMSIIKRYSTRYIECLSSLEDSHKASWFCYISSFNLFLSRLDKYVFQSCRVLNLFSAPQMRCRDINCIEN